MSDYTCSVVLIKRGGHFLGVSRKDNHADIGLPGGKTDPGECKRACAVRETLEETGFHIELDDVEPYVAMGTNVECITYSATLLDKPQEPIAPEETGLVGFFSKQHFLDGCFGDYNEEMFKHFGE